MDITRRQFVLITVAVFAAACGKNSGPSMTAPSAPLPSNPLPQSSTLLLRVQQLPGFAAATRIPYGANGASRISIDGSINWNFLVNGEPVAIGQDSAPTIDVANISVPPEATVSVRSL